jgi:hypothetical protein
MHKLSALLILLLIFSSCKKESSNLIWERSFGTGNAFFIGSDADSGIVSCGESEGKPYLVKLSRDHSQIFDYSYGSAGLFSSAWSDTSGYIAAGSTGGKLLLTRLGKDGNLVWDTTLAAGFSIDICKLIYTGSGTFLAVGSARPDASAENTGLLFVRFDTTGSITAKNEIADDNFISANSAVLDISGNIYLALTMKTAGGKSKAGVAKYNSDFQKLWETVLYNNPDVSSACLDIILSGADSIYVTGKTEVTKSDGTLDNSYIVSMSKTGVAGKKKYLENSNSGSALLSLDQGRLMMLNRNCFIIYIIDPADGYNTEIIRMFSACNSYTTDAFGSALGLAFDNTIMAAGSKGGNFYLALKSSMQ